MVDPQRAFIFPILIPLGTTAPSNRITPGTFALIGASVIVFFVGFSSNLVLQNLAFYLNDDYYRYVTYAFYHEPSWIGFGHLAINMFFLWLFASPLETRIGWWKLIPLYLLCAAAGAYVWAMFQGMPHIALIGSSAAVWGIICSYLILFPFSSVKCCFMLLAVVVPFIVKMWDAAALLFPVIYYFLIFLIYFGAWRIHVQFPEVDLPDPLQFGHVAWFAHLGGMAAGLGLTAAIYGFKAFGEESVSQEAAEKQLQLKLDRKLHGFNPEGAKITSAKMRAPMAVMSPKLVPLHEAVITGNRKLAVRLYHELLEPDATACLAPGPMLDLARILNGESQSSAAMEVLERLIGTQVEADVTAMAKLELAGMLIDYAIDYNRAAELLKDVEASDPPYDLLQEIKQLRRKIPGHTAPEPEPSNPIAAPPAAESLATPTINEMFGFSDEDANRLFGNPEDTDAFKVPDLKEAPPALKPLSHDATTPPISFGPQLSAEPEAELLPQPESEPEPKPIIPPADLFGNPEDTGAFQINIGKPDAPKLKPLTKDETGPPLVFEALSTPSEEAPLPDLRAVRGIDPLAPIFLDDEEDLPSVPQVEKPAPRLAPKPAPQPATDPPAAQPKPAFQPEEHFHFRPSILPNPTILPANDLIPNQQPRVIEQSFEPVRVQITPGGGPSPEIFIGDITHFPSQPELSDTHEQLLILRPGVKYAAILTPGCPVDIPMICAAIAPILGLSPDGTHHALLRRRGIIAEDLNAVEADELARNLSANGQSVSIVAMDNQLEFGPPRDVLTYADEGASARFSISNEVLICRWSQAIFFSAGLVRLDPTSPGRALIDLFFGQPRAHLRIWESTIVYPDRVVKAARGMEGGNRKSDSDHGFLRRDWCFRSMAAEIENHGRNAVRTRSFSTWLDQTTPLPTAHFWSLIEYNNFLRWHLMAYHVPRKKYESEK